MIEPTPADHALAAALRSVDPERWPEMLAIYRLATEQASDKLAVEFYPITVGRADMQEQAASLFFFEPGNHSNRILSLPIKDSPDA